jgi:hypothetical protein
MSLTSGENMCVHKLKTSLALLKHPLFKILPKDGWGKKPKKTFKN